MADFVKICAYCKSLWDFVVFESTETLLLLVKVAVLCLTAGTGSRHLKAVKKLDRWTEFKMWLFPAKRKNTRNCNLQTTLEDTKYSYSWWSSSASSALEKRSFRLFFFYSRVFWTDGRQCSSKLSLKMLFWSICWTFLSSLQTQTFYTYWPYGFVFTFV